jgi:hypothetical protein
VAPAVSGVAPGRIRPAVSSWRQRPRSVRGSGRRDPVAVSGGIVAVSEFRTRPDTGSLLRESDYRNVVTGIQISE